MIDICKGYGRNVRVTCTDGKIITGFYSIHVSAADNEPDPESMVIETDSGLVEIFSPEIRGIWILE